MEAYGSNRGLIPLAEWSAVLPGLVAGITSAELGADFGLTTARSVWDLLENYEQLGRALGFSSIVAARQVHGTGVLSVPDGHRAGVNFAGPGDGLVSAPGPLLVVTVADCVPVYLLSETTPAVALLHAGWRGTCAGILEAGLLAITNRFGTTPNHVRLHLGPAICGKCYEVGGEVMARFGYPERAGHLELRQELTRRARSAGVPAGRITVFAGCTRCDALRFHSHRGSGGAAGRMAAYLGLSPT